MARWFVCDACQYHQETPLPFTLVQRLDEVDDDGAQVEQILDLCGGECLTNFAMGLSLDFPDEPTKEN